MNPGAEENVPVSTGTTTFFPDLVLMAPERGKRLQAVVEVETGESVNHLEALAEWAHFSKLRAAFHLYVPSGMVDVARRLCEDNRIEVGEIWSYFTVGEDVRFTLVHRSREAAQQVRPVARVSMSPRTSAKAKALSSKRATSGARAAVRGKAAPRAKSAKKPSRAQKRK
jgi:hypothetical protein